MLKYQEEILNIIQSSDEHMTAEKIFLKCKEKSLRISVATLYRSLGIMVEQGLITRVSVCGQSDRYDKNMSKHEHIFCERCGKLRDVYIDDLKPLLEARIGMPLSSYDLCMKYVCSECREKEALTEGQNESFE